MGSEDWPEVRLADLCESIDYGYTQSACLEPVGPKFLRITDIVSGPIDWTSVPYCEAAQDVATKYSLRDGDIVIARTGATTGTSTYVQSPPDAVFASYLVRLQVDRTKAHPRFIAFYLRSPEFWDFIRGVLGDKSAQPNASAKTMTQATLRLPPMLEQRRIAGTLGALDDKIELNRRMNRSLESIARAIFKSWFVDFDPVRRKMEGGEVGLPADVAALFPPMLTKMKGSEVPDGWQLEPIGRHIEVVRGLSYHGAGLSEQGLPMHNLNSVLEGGGYKYQGIKFYTGDYQARHMVHKGDVLVANTEQGHRRRLIGFPAVVPSAFGEAGIFSHHLYRVRPVDDSPLSPDYVYHWLVSNRTHQEVSGYATGTTVNMLPPDALALPWVVVPPAQLVRTFDALAARARLRCEQLQSESETIARIRELLLPELLGSSSKRAHDLVCQPFEEAIE